MKKKYFIQGAVALMILAIYIFVDNYFLSPVWTEPMRLTLLLFILSAFFWCTEIIPIHVTALGILLFEIVILFPSMQGIGLIVSKKIFYAPFFSDIILLFMGGFVLSIMLSRYGISRMIASKILGGVQMKSSYFVLTLMAITTFFSMWISNTATTAMVLALVSPITNAEGSDPKIKPLLLLSVAFAANIGGLATPIGTPPNAIALAILSKAGLTISFLNWMLLMLPVVLVLLLFIWQLIFRLFRVDHIPTLSREESETKVTLDFRQKVVIGVFLVTSLAWITAGFHPLSNGEVALVMIFVVFGSGLLQIGDFQKISWHILIILGGGMALGVAVEDSGLAGQLVVMIPQNSESSLIVGSMMFLASFLSTFINNTATANLLVPLAIHLGDVAIASVITITLMCSTSMSMTISTPPNVLAFGMGGIKLRDIFIPGILISAVTMLLLIPFLYYSKLIIGY